MGRKSEAPDREPKNNMGKRGTEALKAFWKGLSAGESNAEKITKELAMSADDHVAKRYIGELREELGRLNSELAKIEKGRGETRDALSAALESVEGDEKIDAEILALQTRMAEIKELIQICRKAAPIPRDKDMQTERPHTPKRGRKSRAAGEIALGGADFDKAEIDERATSGHRLGEEMTLGGPDFDEELIED